MNQKKPVPEVYPVDFNTTQSDDSIISRMQQDNKTIRCIRDNIICHTFLLKNLNPSDTAFLKEAAEKQQCKFLETQGLSGEPCVILHGSRDQLTKSRLAIQNFSDSLEDAVDRLCNLLEPESKKHKIDSFRKQPSLPVIMGVLNVNNESFFTESRFSSVDAVLSRADEMISQGVDIIDVGGESTRPGSQPVPLREEATRVIPAVRAIRKRFDVPISVDTVKAEIAGQAVDEGADMINDISFGLLDESMIRTVVQKDVLYCGMHMKGTPQTMQNNAHYTNVVSEVMSFLEKQAELLENAGLNPDSIIVDPGIGFGKLDNHNLALINSIPALKSLGYPVLIGVSRKSMFGRLLNLDVQDRLPPSLSVAFYSAMKGTDIIRVHDVKETRDALDMLQFLEI